MGNRNKNPNTIGVFKGTPRVTSVKCKTGKDGYASEVLARVALSAAQRDHAGSTYVEKDVYLCPQGCGMWHLTSQESFEFLRNVGATAEGVRNTVQVGARRLRSGAGDVVITIYYFDAEGARHTIYANITPDSAAALVIGLQQCIGALQAPREPEVIYQRPVKPVEPKVVEVVKEAADEYLDQLSAWIGEDVTK